jgi:ribonucleoside-diphosphate reductase alpha chain
MSFLKIGDRAAGAIKSGGTTRRAAKMVICRRRSPRYRSLHRLEGEGGAEGRLAGHRLQDRQEAPLNAIMKRACVNCEADKATAASTQQEPGAEARDQGRQEGASVPENYIKRVIQFARQGYNSIEFPTYDTDWDSEAYLTVSGQNSNNSVS